MDRYWQAPGLTSLHNRSSVRYFSYIPTPGCCRHAPRFCSTCAILLPSLQSSVFTTLLELVLAMTRQHPQGSRARPLLGRQPKRKTSQPSIHSATSKQSTILSARLYDSGACGSFNNCSDQYHLFFFDNKIPAICPPQLPKLP